MPESAPAHACARCKSPALPGAPFCTICGAPFGNNGGRAAGAPQAGPQPAGIVPVVPFAQGPAVIPAVPGGRNTVPAKLALAHASTAKRFVSKLIDAAPPALVSAVLGGVGAGTITVSRSGNHMLLDLSGPLIWSGVAALISIAYWIVLWGWEARTGKTPGNVLLSLRTTNDAGFPAGWGSIFVRGLVIAAGSLIPVAGSVLVLVSNAWDRNDRRQGWHDKAAHTFVFDIKGGRNPLTSGGIDGPSSFAPEPAPALTPVASPLASAAEPAAPANAAPSAVEEPHPDEAVGRTRIARPEQPAAGIPITFDDGRNVRILSEALIGRNPSGYDGEMIDQLLGVDDVQRSVSKTHLHLRADNAGIWVTDRNSTNGSTITLADGKRTPLAPGEAVFAQAGATVHFGDRSFYVGRA